MKKGKANGTFVSFELEVTSGLPPIFKKRLARIDNVSCRRKLSASRKLISFLPIGSLAIDREILGIKKVSCHSFSVWGTPSALCTPQSTLQYIVNHQVKHDTCVWEAISMHPICGGGRRL